MKLVLLILALIFSFTAFSQYIDCHYDDRMSDGSMGEVTLEQEGRFHKLSFKHIASHFGGGGKETNINVDRLDCRFSDHYLHLFECSSVTESGFRGEYAIYGSLVLGIRNKDYLKLEIEKNNEAEASALFPIAPKLTEYRGEVGIRYKGCAGSRR